MNTNDIEQVRNDFTVHNEALAKVDEQLAAAGKDLQQAKFDLLLLESTKARLGSSILSHEVDSQAQDFQRASLLPEIEAAAGVLAEALANMVEFTAVEKALDKILRLEREFHSLGGAQLYAAARVKYTSQALVGAEQAMARQRQKIDALDAEVTALRARRDDQRTQAQNVRVKLAELQRNHADAAKPARK